MTTSMAFWLGNHTGKSGMQFFEIKGKLWHPCEILNAVHESKMPVVELRERKELLLSGSVQGESRAGREEHLHSDCPR